MGWGSETPKASTGGEAGQVKPLSEAWFSKAKLEIVIIVKYYFNFCTLTSGTLFPVSLSRPVANALILIEPESR